MFVILKNDYFVEINIKNKQWWVIAQSVWTVEYTDWFLFFWTYLDDSLH